MPKVVEKKEMKVKSVWANGEYVVEPVEKIYPPTKEVPYWIILLKGGDTLWVTGHVVVKRGPKNPLENLSNKELENRIETRQKGKV